MLFKRPNSKFYWYKFKIAGKRIRESAGTTNRRQALEAESERRNQLRPIALGLEKPPSPPAAPMPKFADYAKEWLEVHVKVNCKKGTFDHRRRILDLHLAPAFGKLTLDAISRPAIETFIAAKIDEKKEKSTVRNYVTVLRTILSKAVQDELLTVNRASRLGRFQKETSNKAGGGKIRYLTQAEVQILLEKALERDFVLYAFFLIAVLTGLRISELIGLQWDDVDLVNHVLIVKRAITSRRLETPKSHYLRTVDIAEDLEPALERLLAYRKEQWLKNGAPVPEWVFCNDEGNFINEFH